MKLLKIVLIAGFVLFIRTGAFAQTVYTFSGYNLCNIDSAGNAANCKDFTGNALFEYFKVAYDFTIEYKFLTEPKASKVKWDKEALGSVEGGSVIYKLIDKDTAPAGRNAGKKNHLTVFLVFDTGNQNKLLKVVYITTENGASNLVTLNVKD